MKKRLIIIIVLCLLLVIVSVYNLIKEESILYLGYSTKVYVNKDDIKIVDTKNDFYTKKIKLFMDDSFVDGFLQVDKEKNINNYKVYNKDKELILNIPFFMAYTGNIKINVPKYRTQSSPNDKDKANLYYVMNDNNIKGDIINYKKITCDLNDDNVDENIIYSLIKSDEYIYSLLYAYSDIDYNYIDLVISKTEDYDNTRIENFETIIDINDDKKYEIVISDYRGNNSAITYRLFGYKNDSFYEIKKEGDK